MKDAEKPVEMAEFAEFAELYLNLNVENQKYALCVAQTLMFAQNTIRVDTQKVG